MIPARPCLPAAVARRRLLAAALALAVPWAAGCTALPAPESVRGNWLEMGVVDRESGDDLRVWRHGADDWVAGTPGSRYALRLANRSGERLLAVVSVDGVNVVSGETASASQRGYVLSPGETVELTGWRKSDSEVAAFEFTRLRSSYAALTGRPGDVGVIGVAVFRERPRPIAVEPDLEARPQASRRDEAAPATPGQAPPFASAAPSAMGRAAPAEAPAAPADRQADNAMSSSPLAKAAPERLGTGHGEREVSFSRTVTFERATRAPQEVLRLRYDRLDRLVAAGVVPRRVASTGAPPRAFPGDEGGFVPDPPRP